MNSKTSFDNKENAKSHIAVLLSIASADGIVDFKESMIIGNIAQMNNISENELNDIINNLETVKFLIPDSLEVRMKQVFELVLLMVSDGQIHEKELQLCRSVAQAYGFRTKLIDDMIENMEKVNNGLISMEDFHNEYGIEN